MSSLDRIKKKRQQLSVENNKSYSSADKSMERIKSLRNELSTTGKIDYGDIAPIKFDNTSTKEEDKKRSWFSAGAFDDGYDFGDVTKTILGTVADVGTNVVKGLTSMGEGIGKLGAGGVAQIADWIGQDEYADKVRDRLAGRDEEYNEFWNKISPTANVNRVSDSLDSSSFIGEKSDDLVSSAGNLLGSMAAQSVGIPWWVTMGTSSAGQELENAYKSGATDGEAWTSAAISGASEILFEKLSGGIKFGGRTLDEGLKRKLSNAIANKTAQTLTKFGFDMVGEGTEEVLTEITSNIGKKLTYEDEKTWGEVLASEEAIDSYIESFVGGAVMGGVFNSGKVVSSLKTGRDYDTGLTANEQKVVDSEVAKRTEGKNLTKKQIAEIETEVKNELEKGYISTDTIESVLGGDTYNNLKSTRDNKTKIENEIKELEGKKNAEITVKEMEHLKDLREQLKGIDTNTLETDLQGKMGQIIKSDGYLQRSYQEKAKRGQKFTYDASKVTNEFEKAALESASKVMNDTNRSHEFVEPIIKLAKDKGTYYEFTNNAELEKSNYDVKGKQVNGLVTVEKDGKKKILINVDSSKALNTIVGHETTHLLEGTQEYQELQDAIFNYAKTKGDFDSRQASLYSLYKDIKGADVNSELTADLVGDYLFTDNNFISELSTQKPTVFQKIKELIDDLVVRFKGTKEEKALREVQKKFKEAYRQQSGQQTGQQSATKTDTQYSIVGERGLDYNEGVIERYTRENLEKAQQLEEKGETPEEIFKKTGWYKGIEGKWKFEIDDSNWNIKKELKENSSYTLGDVLEAPELYKIYPGYKHRQLVFGDLGGPEASFNRETQVLEVDNKYINDTEGLKSVLSHELQHTTQTFEWFASGSSPYAWLNEKKSYERQLKKINDELEVLYDEIGFREFDYDLTFNQLFQEKITMEEYEQKRKEFIDNTFWGKEITELEQKRDKLIANNKWAIREIGDLYKNTAGEIEARQVQERLNMLPEERKNNIPFIGNENTVFNPIGGGTKNTIKYSLTDNQGRTLTKEQQEYFKDSKVRDENGNLLTVYHGSENEFNTFDIDRTGARGSYYTSGFYFTTSKESAKDYATNKGKIYETYLNITNPYIPSTDIINEDGSVSFAPSFYEEFEQKFKDRLPIDWKELNSARKGTAARYILQDLGYDGVINGNVYVAFNPNQIKNIDNTNPTTDADIRYSLSEDTQVITTSKDLTKRIDEIKNQREELRQQLLELRQERNSITDSIPNYSMFKQYDELNDVNKRMDNNKNLSKELYAELQDLETKLEEVKEQEKNERIAKEEAEATPHKLAQNRIIQETNPMLDDYHTGIRSVGDIKTWQEAMTEAEEINEGYSWGDFSKEDAQKALKRGTIRVYSSYAIKNGTFVSTSYQQALDYAGGERSKVHSKEVALDSVAWISVDEGQYAKVYKKDYSLSNQNEIAPRNPNLTYGEDVKLQVEETIAPLQEEIQTLTETVNELKEQIAPVRDEYAPLTEEDLPYLEQQYNEAPKEDIAPPETEENIPVAEDEITSTKSLFETRNYEEVGNRKVNAYQYDNPEVKPYFQEAARSMIDDLANSLKGQRIYNDQLYYDTAGEQGYFGITRTTTNDIAELLDGVDGKYKLSYKDLEKGLKAIIEDHGAENNAASKRIEFYLDKRLREGFKTLDGVEIPANQEYLKLLEAIETTDYHNSIPIGEAPVESVDVPTSDISNTKVSEDIAPIKEQETQQPVEENKNLSIKDSNALKLKNLEKALDKYNSDAEESLKAFNELILEKKKQYSGLSNRNTQKANNLLQQITRIETQRDNAQVEYERKMNNVQKRIDKMNSKDFKTAEQRITKQQEYRQQARELIGDTSTWKDKKMGISYQIHTFKRNLRDIVRGVDGKTDLLKADAIYEEYEGKYDKNEAKLKVEYNRIMNPYAELDLTEQEHIYTQMLGEFKYNPDTTLTKEKVDAYYNKHKSKIDVDKVNNAIESARKTYDELFDRINERLREQGMKELEYRRGYFPHFVEEKQGLLAKIFDWKIHKDDIPTDIAGLTELNNPERSWQSFNKHRESDITDYNFGKGLETYVRGALDWIYHIEDIQKRRALENEIRYQHSEKGVQEQIEAIYSDTELDTDQIQERIDAVYKTAQNPLNNFITDFRNATNRLANKKSTMDRSLEYATNRRIYSTMTNLSNRVSGNMIGGSISSALTNFIPITQSWGEVSPLSSLKAIVETIKNATIDDGTIAKSTFLTNRLVKNEKLYKTGWDKAQDKIAIMTDAIDSFTAQTVWRSKYNENIASGMSETEAIANADNFAKNVIAGRSRGNEPTIFHSKNPITKMFTAFQIEVANQYDYMFKDMPKDVGNQSKAKLIKGYATMFIGAYLYNALYSSLVGRDAAFDPIGIVEDILKELGFGDDEEEEKTASEKFTAITEDLVQQLPFVGGLFGGGRVPISAAIPYDNPIEMVKGTTTDLLDALDEEKREKSLKDLTSEWLKPVTYLALPVGGGQINKTIQGLSMYDDDLPVAGSYTNSGDLRFTADTSPSGVLKSALFGRWASDSAQEYVDSGFKTVKKSNIDEMVDLDMSSTEYRKYRNGLKKAGTKNEDKINYINSLDVSDEHKNIMANNVLKRDYDVDMSDYGEMSGYDEFDYSYKNPEKYKLITQIDTFDNYNSYKEDIADIKEQYSEDKGYSTKERKAAVQQYINSLSLDIPQKIMLEKMAGGYSIKDYENYMFSYIQSLPMTAEEKQAIHKQLFD